jgi:hypothetical protein
MAAQLAAAKLAITKLAIRERSCALYGRAARHRQARPA